MTGLANAGTHLQKRHFSAGQATIVNKLLANGTPGPSTFEQGPIPIQAFSAHPTGLGLNSQDEGLPFSSTVSDTHRIQVY